MSAQFYTLKALKSRIESLIEEKGADAPVAYWVYTADDVLTYDDDGEEVYFNDEFTTDVLIAMQDYSSIHESIQDCINEEIRYASKESGTEALVV